MIRVCTLGCYSIVLTNIQVKSDELFFFFSFPFFFMEQFNFTQFDYNKFHK